MNSTVEMRKAKAELHKEIIDIILSYGFAVNEEKEMYRYVIELAVNELMRF